jgi:hypothetical protein
MKFRINLYNVIIGKPESKRPLQRLRHKLDEMRCGIDSSASGEGSAILCSRKGRRFDQLNELLSEGIRSVEWRDVRTVG